MGCRAIYLIRHAETEWSASGRHTGLSDIPLTQEGQQQAATLNDPLHKIPFAKVWTSPLKRALETCTLAGYSAEMQIDPDLVEWDYGAYEGLQNHEICQQNPGWNLFKDGVPNGETIEGIGRRADRMIQKAEQCSGNIALFSSGHFLRVLTMRFLQLPIAEGRRFILSTASISILGYEKEARALILWNDTLFLKSSGLS